LMYERTNICPYTEVCENFQSIINVERWLYDFWGKAISGRTSPMHEDYTIVESERSMRDLVKAKEKCLRYHNRCLKFWQFKAQERGIPARGFEGEEVPIQPVSPGLRILEAKPN